MSPWLMRSILCLLSLTAACGSDGDDISSPHSLLTAAAPTIELTRTEFRFCIPFSGGATRPCGARGAFGINNTGRGTLHWTATKTGTWLRISRHSGTTLSGMQSGMQVWVVGTGVAPGSYVGRIRVWATGATNSPQTVQVYFTKR
ncbi:MAG: BACON domain-containing protein [Gemmatimonadales bacterium]